MDRVKVAEKTTELYEKTFDRSRPCLEYTGR